VSLQFNPTPLVRIPRCPRLPVGQPLTTSPSASRVARL
jgi:hypothetical protein